MYRQSAIQIMKMLIEKMTGRKIDYKVNSTSPMTLEGKVLDSVENIYRASILTLIKITGEFNKAEAEIDMTLLINKIQSEKVKIRLIVERVDGEEVGDEDADRV